MNELLDAGAVIGVTSVFATAGLPRRDLGLVALAVAIAVQLVNAWHLSASPDYAQALATGLQVGLQAAGAFSAAPVIADHTRATGSAVKSAVSRRPRVSVASPLRVNRAPEAPPAVWETPASQ